jgi:hypothetical protein
VNLYSSPDPRNPLTVPTPPGGWPPCPACGSSDVTVRPTLDVLSFAIVAGVNPKLSARQTFSFECKCGAHGRAHPPEETP